MMPKTSRMTLLEVGMGEIPSENVNHRMEHAVAATTPIVQIPRGDISIGELIPKSFFGRFSAGFRVWCPEHFAQVVALHASFSDALEGAEALVSRLLVECQGLEIERIHVREFAPALTCLTFRCLKDAAAPTPVPH